MKKYPNEVYYTFSPKWVFPWRELKSSVRDKNLSDRGKQPGSIAIQCGYKGIDRRLFTCELLQALYL